MPAGAPQQVVAAVVADAGVAGEMAGPEAAPLERVVQQGCGAVEAHRRQEDVGQEAAGGRRSVRES